MLSEPQGGNANSTIGSNKTADELVLVHCTSQEVFELFYSWSHSEQWNPSTKGHDIRDIYYKADPEGFFLGKVDGQVVSIVSAVRYGDDQAWIGYYIVSPDHRGKGYGLDTFRRALAHVNQGGERPSIGLDGVMAQVDNYRKSGFVHVAWKNERKHGSAKDLVETIEKDLAEGILQRAEALPGLVVAQLDDPTVDVEQLVAIEQRFTGLKRPEFVRDWVRFHAAHPGEHRFGAAILSADKKDETTGKPLVLGFGCVRPAVTSYRIGPLYATSGEAARLLLVKLAVDVVQAEEQNPMGIPLKFDIDIPNTNKAAAEMFDRLGWVTTFPSLRMWKGKIPESDVNGVYGVLSLEVG
ncbi:hypothetical protein BG011_006447 [Mortierella polycephala]|uniref:N-acetyltransferase domain-containing protein n=1 Tax=Mortierella polycephala TaxID=41804 RepID=A0A9P6PUS3_9FUNG|nr:hypothetical protein BG011_006447 [Mortierella polycephala]